mmetsp:Transcript_95261/g.308529  ORF Transcript_95261/g.308529 Transcript_95261/m.308529 type:complete len:207 (+) Transcript_95261:578-1198(+)
MGRPERPPQTKPRGRAPVSLPKPPTCPPAGAASGGRSRPAPRLRDQTSHLHPKRRGSRWTPPATDMAQWPHRTATQSALHHPSSHNKRERAAMRHQQQPPRVICQAQRLHRIRHFPRQCQRGPKQHRMHQESEPQREAPDPAPRQPPWWQPLWPKPNAEHLGGSHWPHPTRKCHMPANPAILLPGTTPPRPGTTRKKQRMLCVAAP